MNEIPQENPCAFIALDGMGRASPQCLPIYLNLTTVTLRTDNRPTNQTQGWRSPLTLGHATFGTPDKRMQRCVVIHFNCLYSIHPKILCRVNRQSHI